MKKKEVLAVLGMFLLLFFAAGNSQVYAEESVNLSLFPPVQLYQKPSIRGVDLGLIMTESKNVVGVQFCFIVNKTDKIVGVQYGFVNIAKDVKGLQWGFINYTEKLYGVQLGLLNIAVPGRYLPFCVFLNVGF